MYGEWVTLPELDGNTIIRVFVFCTTKTSREEKVRLARKQALHYLERLEETP